MDTIKLEASKNSKKSVDLDNFRSRYTETHPDRTFTITYPSTEIYTFEHHYFVLLSKSNYVEFKPSWEMRPDYTSFDMYGSVIFWPVILFVNNVYSIEDYINMEGVYLPPYRNILKLVRDRVPKHHVEPVYIYRDIPGINLYDKGLLDDVEIEGFKGRENIQEQTEQPPPVVDQISLEEHTDVISITQDILLNEKFTLTRTPVNASTTNLYIENLNVPQRYGYHYVLKYNPSADKNNIISWARTDLFNETGGMSTLLEAGMTVRVVYLYERRISQ
jgi:hypothetical protein